MSLNIIKGMSALFGCYSLFSDTEAQITIVIAERILFKKSNNVTKWFQILRFDLKLPCPALYFRFSFFRKTWRDFYSVT